MKTQQFNPTDQVQGSAMLNRIIKTHYPMSDQSQEQKAKMHLLFVKIDNAIVDAQYECFEISALRDYYVKLAAMKATVRGMKDQLSNDPNI